MAWSEERICMCGILESMDICTLRIGILDSERVGV